MKCLPPTVSYHTLHKYIITGDKQLQKKNVATLNSAHQPKQKTKKTETLTMVGWNNNRAVYEASQFTKLLLNLLKLRDLFSVWTKLNKSIFKDNNQINSIITTRGWVLMTEWPRTWPSTGLLSEWKSGGGLRLLEWSMLFLRISRCCIVVTEMRVTIVSATPSFSKRCQCNFSEIFKGKQIILEPCRNSQCSNRCLKWCHKILPGTIWKTWQE